MNTMGYDFKDVFIPAGKLSFAFRVSCEDTVYGPHPEYLSMERSGNRTVCRAGMLTGAGGQISREGSFEIHIEEKKDRITLRAKACHGSKKCLRMLVLVKGMDIREMEFDSVNVNRLTYTKGRGTPRISYPGRTPMMPLVFIHGNDGKRWFALSKDAKIRQKVFCAQPDPISGEPLLMLTHSEDARFITNTLEMPEWHFGVDFESKSIVSERLEDLRTNHGLEYYRDRRKPVWVDDIRLVALFHGIHWTGHVFSTFLQMEEMAEWVCRRMDAGQVLFFLPAWDGDYYRTYPCHEPAERMGGAEGLLRLVKTCHRLGARIIPMLGGPNLAVTTFLEEHDMMDAVLKTEANHPKVQDWVDWNNDLVRETEGYIMNFGHPRYLRHMVDSSLALVDKYGFDGIFLDGAIRWENAPDHSPYEGLKAWSSAMREKHPDILLMGEDGYDAQWGLFDMFGTFECPLGLENGFLAYSRMAHYLAYPGPDGSCGIHEQAWNPEGVKKAIPGYTIPTMSFTRNGYINHKAELEEQLKRATEWRMDAYEK